MEAYTFEEDTMGRRSYSLAPPILISLGIVATSCDEPLNEQPNERQGQNYADESSGLKTLEGWQSNGDGRPYRQSWQSLLTP
jgi:hypothetical protein